MLTRYAPDDFVALWSTRSKYETWFDVEVAACAAMETVGRVPKGTSDAIRPARTSLKPDRIDEIERGTKHDVIAFLTHVEELVGAPARWLHLGMTSSDVLDTSTALLLTRAGDALLERTERLKAALAKRVEEHRHTPMMGRSHGIHAEPVTFGLVLAGHYAEVERARVHLVDARQGIAVGKIAGAVGTYAHLSLEVERRTLESLGLAPETVSTQVVARDRHAALFFAIARLASAIERFAINVRHWQRTEVGEAEEFFSAGQKGSSAMPHKRNPVLSENLTGLARMVRSAVGPAMENIGLWHERDISHSSVERFLAPDATTTAAFMLDRARGLVERLVAYPERMKSNLERTGSLWASEGVLLELVQHGVGRQDGYVMVQRNAMKAHGGEGDFKSLLLSDPEICEHITPKLIERQFDLKHALAHVDEVIDRALES